MRGFGRGFLLAVAVGLATVQPATASGVVAGSALAPLPPGVDYTDKGLSREVLGFLGHSRLDYGLQYLDYAAVSTIAFFSLPADRNGHLVKRTSTGAVGPQWGAWSSSKMTTIIGRAHANLTKVVPSIQRFAWNSSGAQDTIALLSRATARQTLANEIAAAVVARGVDGVNLDFEPIPSSQRANYVTFVRQVRQALNARRLGYQLTFAATGYIANYDVRSLTAPGAADAVYIMGYQYRGSWSTRAGSTAPLTGTSYDVTDTVNAYLGQTSASKIILGVPYYGYGWSTSTSLIHSTPTGAYRGSVLYAQAMALAARYGTRYDTLEQAAWTVYRVRPCSTCSLQWRQVYFDNVRSLGAKYDLVKRKGLRGTGIWALGFEGSRTELYTLLKQKFAAP
jgi:spore germination protein YaaH